MDTKLTLKIEESTISKAKSYARKKNISLSKMIENYLNAVTNKQDRNLSPSPLVESLLGVIDDKNIDDKKDYANFMSEKYK